PLPGQVVQEVLNTDSATNSGTTLLPRDNTTPQNNEGTQFMTQAITPSSAANVLSIEWLLEISNGADGLMAVALFQDSTTNALTTVSSQVPADQLIHNMGRYRTLAGTTSSTTFKLRAGSGSGGTQRFNSTSIGALYNGTLNSHLMVRELMI